MARRDNWRETTREREYPGRGRGGGGRPPTLESVATVALVVAAGLFVVEVAADVLTTTLGPGSVDVGTIVRFNLTDIISDAALFGGVTVAIVGGATRDLLVRVAAGIYVANLAEALLDALLRSVLTNVPTSVPPSALVTPTFAVVTFFGIVMVYRLFTGQTILPGLEYRLST